MPRLTIRRREVSRVPVMMSAVNSSLGLATGFTGVLLGSPAMFVVGIVAAVFASMLVSVVATAAHRISLEKDQ
jgi:hypothetical protein